MYYIKVLLDITVLLQKQSHRSVYRDIKCVDIKSKTLGLTPLSVLCSMVASGHKQLFTFKFKLLKYINQIKLGLWLSDVIRFFCFAR